MAAHAYASDQDGFLPLRLARDGGVEYRFSWPWTYYKTRTGGKELLNLIDSFIAPYLNNPKAFYCPSVAEDDARHTVGGEKTFGLSWQEIKRLVHEVATPSSLHGNFNGDYSLFTGYNMTDRDLIQITGSVRFGEIIPIPPRNQADDRDLNDQSPSPVKVSTTRAGTALSGDLLQYTNIADNRYRSNHPYVPTRNPSDDEPDGMNAAFIDGSARWVEFERVAPFMQYRDGGAFYWPDPSQ
jgi:hypothetical protein